MSIKLTKQERLYDVTQLAKAIFVEDAHYTNFSTVTDGTINLKIQECFELAEAFINYQERYAEEIQ